MSVGPVPGRFILPLSTSGTVERLSTDEGSSETEIADASAGIAIEGIDQLSVTTRTDGPVFYRLWDLTQFVTARYGKTAVIPIRINMNVHLTPTVQRIEIRHDVVWKWKPDSVEFSIPEKQLVLGLPTGDAEIEIVIAPGGFVLLAHSGEGPVRKAVMVRFVLRPLSKTAPHEE